jgi:cytoskeleton protein RodZ
MESVGEFFRQVRETKGLTVDEVSSKTRIRSDFVKALEDGNFSKLPDQVFARGFVRSYARSLGLDEEDAIQRFTKSAGAFYDKQDERERLKIRQFEEERKRQANRKAVSVAIGIAVLVLIFLLSREQSSVLRVEDSDQIYAKQNIERNIAVAKDQLAAASSGEPEPAAEAPKQSEGQAASESQVSTEDARRPEPIPPPIAAPKPESPTVSAASSGADGPLGGISLGGDGIAGDGQLVLDLEATELSWVVVQIDNGSPQESLLRPGEKAQWKGQDQFILTLGNAGGVKAELNGKPQKPFGPSGKVARDIILKR